MSETDKKQQPVGDAPKKEEPKGKKEPKEEELVRINSFTIRL